MRDSESTFARGGELLAGLLVVAFIVFLLWVVLLRPRDDESTDVSATPTPATAITPTPDDPNTAFDQVIATPTPEPTPTATPIPRPTPTPTATKGQNSKPTGAVPAPLSVARRWETASCPCRPRR